jgi:hypothetical protein
LNDRTGSSSNEFIFSHVVVVFGNSHESASLDFKILSLLHLSLAGRRLNHSKRSTAAILYFLYRTVALPCMVKVFHSVAYEDRTVPSACHTLDNRPGNILVYLRGAFIVKTASNERPFDLVSCDSRLLSSGTPLRLPLVALGWRSGTIDHARTTQAPPRLRRLG